MSGFDAESYAAAWRRRNRKEEERIKARIPQGLEEARRLAGIIAAEAGTK